MVDFADKNPGKKMPMKKAIRGCVVLFSLVLLQRVEAQGRQAQEPRNPASQLEQPANDSLGRGTPEGTVVGLVKAVQEGNLERAAEYLDSRLNAPDRRELARTLGVVLDRKLLTSVGQRSSRPEGDVQDGLRTSRDRVGLVASASGNVDIFVDRVQRGQDSPIWLFSADTLQEIPRLYDEVQELWIEQYLPDRLISTRWLSIPLYRWIGILLFVPLFLGLAALASRLLTVLLRRVTRGHRDRALTSLGPLRLQMIAFLFYGASFFGLTLTARRLWLGIAGTLTVIALCWLSLRVMDLVAALTLARLQRTHGLQVTALVRMLTRLAKALAVIVAGLVLLYLSGSDLTAVLAGLGVGGLAIGFGAQRTIENLFGGIMVISDKPVNVGDICRAGEFFGTVEDIGLRSTRIRTLDRTVVSIPNGQLATMSLENFAVRDRIWFHHAVRLGLETTADQLRTVLAGIGRLLGGHPAVDATSARVRFIRFGAAWLEIEVFAYVRETDQAAFLAIQEELLLDIMGVIDASGASVALPPRATDFADDGDVDR